MANKTLQFDYPIIIKHIHGFLTVSVPDLGIDAKIPVTADFYETEKLEQNKEKIWQLLCNVIRASTLHLETKKWVPDASQIKTQLKKPEKDYSLPEFCKVVSQYITVSENTLRREIKKGKIICYITDGGHRRIPESEVKRYLESSNLQNNLSTEV